MMDSIDPCPTTAYPEAFNRLCFPARPSYDSGMAVKVRFHTLRLFVALSLPWLSILSLSGVLEADGPSPVILGYYESPDLKPSQIWYGYFTHLIHAALNAAPDGHIVTKKTIPDPELVRLAHEAGVQVLLSVGGGNKGENQGKILRRVAKNPQSLDRFVRGLVALLNRYGYDGVDIDWETPEGKADRANLVKMVKKLRQAFPKRETPLLLALAVPAGDDKDGFDAPALAPYVDFFDVMTYDFHGPWSSHAGHNAPQTPVAMDKEDGVALNVQTGMDYWWQIKKVPKNQLVLGIPCYGRGFVTESWYGPIKGKSRYEYIEYKDIVALQKDGWQKQWDDKAGVPFLYKAGVQDLISFDDENSVRQKAGWARDRGYRGLFFYEIPGDFVDGDNKLVSAGRDEFFRR